MKMKVEEMELVLLDVRSCIQRSTDRSTPPKYPKYASKTARVSSFNDCGDIVIPPDSLATSGFFYAGFGDCVRCFQCGVGLRHWSEEDDPWIEHSRWSKDCLFVKQVKGQEFVNLVQMAVQYSHDTNGNSQASVTITAGQTTGCSVNAEIERQMHTDAVQTALEIGYSQDVIRNALRAIRNKDDGRTLSDIVLIEKILDLEDEASASVQGTPENQLCINHSKSASSNSASIQVVVMSELPPATNSYSGPTESFRTQTRTDRSTPPKYPKYANKTARVSSYNDCGDIVIQPDSLATSGFFYVGFGDCVRCFQCGVGLHHWSEEDDPWIEHSRWSKDCLFVKQVRGQEFVNIVQMAVQYSQNNLIHLPGQTTGCSVNAEIERQMHTDAFQTALEIGYSQDVIRNALRAIRNRDDGRTLSTRILIEKILDFQGTPENQISINNSGSASSKSDCIESVGMCDMAPAKKSDSGPTKSFRTQTPSLDISCDGIDETWELNNENQRLRDILFCLHCKNKVREVVFLSCPCPHLLFCNICYLFYDICPVCNTPVKALMNVRW